jgi:hypothetical protein
LIPAVEDMPDIAEHSVKSDGHREQDDRQSPIDGCDAPLGDGDSNGRLGKALRVRTRSTRINHR